MGGEKIDGVPHNLDAEQCVLGAMLLDEEAISEALTTLKEEHFYRDAHKRIFSGIVNLYEKRTSIDLVTLCETLRKNGDLDRVGGAPYVSNLLQLVPTTAGLEGHARIVKEKFVLRSLMEVAADISDRARREAADADAILEQSEKKIFEITQGKTSSDFIAVKDIVEHSLELADRLFQRKKLVTGVATGFDKVDEMASGLQDSDFIVIAGRPSMGKSAFMLAIAEHAGVVNKVPVGIFSLEMSREALVQRMLCSYAKIDNSKLRTGYLSKDRWVDLTNAAQMLAEAPIFIDDSATLSVLELRAKARRLKTQHDVGIIFLDYLQLMQSSSRSESRQQEISEISRSLKALARELKVPVVAVSQLSRAVESRDDHKPRLSDLRESGAIEQDADVVAMLVREEYYKLTPENENMAELVIAKQRNGPVGDIKMVFRKEFTRFENFTEQEVPV